MTTNIKLQQGQIYDLADAFIRVVRVERLLVEYKKMKDLSTRDGTHHEVSKKEFCRLIKNAPLLGLQLKEVAKAQKNEVRS